VGEPQRQCGGTLVRSPLATDSERSSILSSRSQAALATPRLVIYALKVSLSVSEAPQVLVSVSNRPRVPSAELEGELVSSEQSATLPSLEVRLGGIFVPTEKPLPVGTVVTLKLRAFQSESELSTVARVAYVVELAEAGPNQKAGMGMEFVDVWGKRATEQLTHYLREAATTAPPATQWMAGVRVLVVDDSQPYRERAAEVMREAGFDVLTASNGLEALSLALKHQPSIILTDVTMPGMDGWQLLRLVRARPTLRHTPVVFLTALTSDAERLRGYELGVDDYLAKPFSNVELVARVERVLERANAAEQAVADGMRGDLSKVPLASLLSLADMERRAGVLQLTRDGDKATLHLRDGRVVRIDLNDPHDKLEGIQRFFHVLGWESGRFELIATDVSVEDVMMTPTSFALLEYAHLKDEAARRTDWPTSGEEL
jgi:DNA-binding response OmpR family regulator/Tfp pilus assembly protein PilZ